MKEKKNHNQKGISHVHCIGIGGIGISALARMYLLEGKSVSGSDAGESVIIEGLKNLGVTVHKGHAREHVPAHTDLVVYTIAVTEDNPELLEARERNLKMLTYPQALGQVSAAKKTIAVSGTHGKTTTTAMIGNILRSNGLDASMVVGSLLPELKSNFVAGQSEHFIVEACEYRRSFLNLSPYVLVITNIDNDHLDYYKDIDDIISAFKEMAAKVPAGGAIVCDPSHPYVAQAISGAKGKIIDYSAVSTKGLALKVPGKHNVANAKAALAVAEFFGVPHGKSVSALNTFAGTWRRFEYRGETSKGAKVYDDYGHHPTEIRATLAAARELYPDARIIVAFQPHLYSRTKLLLDDFACAFTDVDRVLLAPIYAAREPHDETISSGILAGRITLQGTDAFALSSLAAVTEALQGDHASGDIILTLGAGETNTVADALIAER